MGAAIDAVGDAGKILRHNPFLVVGGIVVVDVFMLLGIIANVVLSFTVGLIPIIGQLVQWVVIGLVVSAFVTGLLGMAYDGRNGNTSIGSFVTHAADGFLSYFGAYSIITLGQVVLTIVMVLVVFVVGIGSIGVADAGGSPESLLAGLGVFAIILLVVALLVAIVGLLIQFFDIAIVADDATAVSSFSKSAELVTSTPLSVIGYSILRFLIFGVGIAVPYVLFGVLGTGAAAAGETTQAPDAILGTVGIGLIVGMTAWLLVLFPLAIVATFTYHAAYYNRQKALGHV